MSENKSLGQLAYEGFVAHELPARNTEWRDVHKNSVKWWEAAAEAVRAEVLRREQSDLLPVELQSGVAGNCICGARGIAFEVHECIPTLRAENMRLRHEVSRVKTVWANAPTDPQPTERVKLLAMMAATLLTRGYTVKSATDAARELLAEIERGEKVKEGK